MGGLLRVRLGSNEVAAILCACRTSAHRTIRHMQYQGHHESSSWAWLDRRPGALPGLTIVSHLILSLSAAACYQASRSQAFSPGHLDALALVPTPPSLPLPPFDGEIWCLGVEHPSTKISSTMGWIPTCWKYISTAVVLPLEHPVSRTASLPLTIDTLSSVFLSFLSSRYPFSFFL